MTRPLVVPALLGLLGLLALVAAPAQADSRIGLSIDGQTWATSLAHPLFDPTVRWVPGDVRTAHFHVRNQATTAADLRVEVHSADADRLVHGDDIVLEARAAGGPWQPLFDRGSWQALDSRTLGVGDAVGVELRATFAPQATNKTQEKSVPLRFLVTLSEAGTGTLGSTASDSGSGALPATGSHVRPWMLWLTAIMVGTGAALTRRSRSGESS